MPLPKLNKLLVALAILAIIGFADASFVALETSRGEIPPCAIGGCDLVLQSEYASIFGISVAAIGAVYYGLVILFVATFLITERKSLVTYIAILTGAGAIISLFLVYLQLFVIESLCLYCLISAGTSFALFTLAWMVVKTIKQQQN